jgi:hypothetical protein
LEYCISNWPFVWNTSFNVCIYADPAKPMVDGRAIECAYNIAGANPLEQAYAHLKTMPEFAGAVDC